MSLRVSVLHIPFKDSYVDSQTLDSQTLASHSSECRSRSKSDGMSSLDSQIPVHSQIPLDSQIPVGSYMYWVQLPVIPENSLFRVPRRQGVIGDRWYG